jgi:hypothetical protein
MSKDQIFTLIAAVFYLGILYLLVRPTSKGPTIVNNIFNAFSDLIRGSIGYTYDSTTGSWTAP